MIDEDSSRRDQAMQAAAQVLRAGAWLIRNGYGAMRLLPYTAPSGCYWMPESFEGKIRRKPRIIIGLPIR